jgi:hypothetical protein
VRNGLAVFIALAVAAAAGFGLWMAFSRNAGEVSTPAPPVADTDTIADTPPAPSTPVDLSNPIPEIHVTSEVNAPAPVVVNEPAIRGRVVDEFDIPVEGVAVTAYDVNIGPQRTFTNADGVFAIGDLVAGHQYKVSAIKAHFNAASEEITAPIDGLELVLTYTSSAAGRVVDEFGHPVTRFDVVYVDMAIDNDALWKEIVRSGATSWKAFENPEGRYEIANVASGTPFSLGARAEGFEAAMITVPAVAPAERASPPDIILKADARIDGLVLSHKRAPAPGANIHLGPDAEGPVVGRTDGTGRFILSGLGDAPIELTADHEAHLPATVRVVPRRGEVTPVEIIFGQGGTLIGRVTRGSQAAPGQTVIAMRLTEPRIRKQAVTGEDGRYRIEGLGTGILDVLSKYALPGGGTPLRIQSQVEIVVGAEAALNFDFPHTLATLEGRVTANGTPIAAADIRGTIDTPQGQATFNATAEDDGSYRIGNIIPGDAWVTVSGWSNDVELRRTVAAELPGGEVTRLDVDFDETTGFFGEVTNIGANEAGQVLALAGHIEVDVSTVEAILRLESIKAGESDIDENGLFFISGVTPGEYTLVALVFRADTDTGNDAINTIRVAMEKAVLPESGGANVTLSLRP